MIKERYQTDYSFNDHVRDFFGIGPKDTDHDGVPDSYEIKHGLNVNNPDTDHDGVFDGQELVSGTDPLNNDTDGDLVIDGRDEAPLDSETSSIGIDTDGDGISDKIEKIIGTDVTKKDTDGDGITDNMDTYPLDAENIGQIIPLDLSKSTEGLHLSIQNPALSLFADMLSVAMIVLLLIFAYVLMRWFLTFLEMLNHYDHHFQHSDYNNHGRHSTHHIIKDTHDSTPPLETPFGIAGLAVGNGPEIPPPTPREFFDHPKFAIIEGYMSSQSEALWRIGIMEADNILLEVLAEKGYQGDGVAEKLKNASFKTIDLAWDAHKIRNRIAHEGSDFELTEREAKRAFMLYESVLRDLKAIR